MKITQKQLYEIIKIIATAVLSVAATLLAHSCAVQTNVQKDVQNSSINGEQTQKVDSIYLSPKF